MSYSVSILMTCDIDPTPEATIEDKRSALDQCLTLFANHGIKATYYFVAKVIGNYPEQVKDLLSNGHEIGCHGLTHDGEEEYNSLDETRQRLFITEALQLISHQTKQPVKTFRGPRVKTSATTQKLLDELGVESDSSVCSQRIDFISSNLINWGWVFAPRNVYHPHKNSAFRRGDRKVWVIPVSAIILPFLSGTLYTFGLLFMKIFFCFLYFESRITGKPIVYLIHPAEFAEKKSDGQKALNKPLKVEGFKFRRSKYIFEQNLQKRYDLNDKLFQFMQSFKKVNFLTVSDFIENIDLDKNE